MTNGNNVITYYCDENGKPDRLRDYYVRQLFRRGAILGIDGWPIENEKGEIDGAFWHITGPKTLVNFLSWLTNLHFGKWNKVDVQTDETGQINQVKEL